MLNAQTLAIITAVFNLVVVGIGGFLLRRWIGSLQTREECNHKRGECGKAAEHYNAAVEHWEKSMVDLERRQESRTRDLEGRFESFRAEIRNDLKTDLKEIRDSLSTIKGRVVYKDEIVQYVMACLTQMGLVSIKVNPDIPPRG